MLPAWERTSGTESGAEPGVAVARDGGVRVPGACSSGVTSKLTLGEEDGRIEVEFELDQHRAGVPWRVTVHRNDARVFAGTRLTRAPGGSLSVRRVVDDGPGADRVVVRALTASGGSCRASAVFG